jgi:hypothetical protein
LAQLLQPLAPIPVPPHLQEQHQAQQQQALVAHQQPTPNGAGQWATPGYYNPMTGLPS